MKMKYWLFILALIPFIGKSQIDRDSLFNSERTMDRRFTLYKGQIRVEGGYEFLIFKSEYDDAGEKELLSASGTSASQHDFNVHLRYGIIDFLDLEARFKYKKRNYRGEPVYIVGAPSLPRMLYTDVVTSGMEDIYLGLNARAPIPTNKLDIGASFGLYFPSANSEPDKPQHKFSTDGSLDQVNYYYLENWGYGVMSTFYQGHIKYRLQNIAFSFNYQLRVPGDVSESLTWYSRLNEYNKFAYAAVPYTYQEPQKSQFGLLFEFQPFQWVNIYLGYASLKSTRGWTEESGDRVAIPDAKLSILYPGFEVLVSNRLWLRQRVQFPLGGTNSMSPFSIQTTFFYNLFVN